MAFYDDPGREAILCARLILDADSEGTSLGSKDEDGRIPLHYASAVMGENLQLLPLLIDATTDQTLVLAQDKWGQLPLHYSIAIRHHGGAACFTSKFVAALLQADHEKKSLHIADNSGRLPVHCPALEGCLACVKLLVEADVTRSSLLVRDRDGATPLECAQRGQEDHEREGYRTEYLEDKLNKYIDVVQYLTKATAEAQRLQANESKVADSTAGSSS
ncbi:uncharacterized protein MYCFIDRAFT_210128 [Pseudocercospora fijiensis CIRAD86]|uniref:Uncharacterized protein n=1 Tax=Pseudocercospora fijiensis (strain CIRAD86) TaxID=383855 RepID=N1QD05_PSEFD|nr:uncharacterized protein MYCFIDRAFT_210128 [Pseudocercospora fijiensis CIRAD86]EME89543.1 hypothetical protein MYCFIDRAFT_210128 [Pseudocercospora fijiensis CIRAD86]